MSPDDWVEYTPERTRPKLEEPLAVVSRSSQLRLTPAAVRLLGDPEYIVFQFDRIGRRVALRTSHSDVRHAFPLRKYGSGSMFTVAAESFYKWADISHNERAEYRVEQVGHDTILFRLDGNGTSTGALEEFRYKGVLLAHRTPNVSISRSGHITFNEAAKELIPAVERVVFLYNPARQMVGLRPAQDEPHARPIRRSAGQRTWALAGEGFLKRFGIEHDHGRSYEPFLNDQMLVIDLNRPKAPRRPRRQRVGEVNEAER